MKKNIVVAAVAATVALASTTQSCVALATSSVGLAILKRVLLGGITKGLNIFSNKYSFLSNGLISAALPSQLQSLNATLERIGLSHLVEKEKDYIAQAAAYTVNISQPILVNAVNNLTAQDAARIVQGGAGAATEVLREKTSAQLIAAIMPKVDEKLNQFGIVRTLNSALAGSNLLGNILNGGQPGTDSSLTAGLSRFASEQMVNGLFNIIQNHERQNQAEITKAISALPN